MSARFEEIDWQPTPLGELALRRRRDPATGTEVYEIKLDDDYLMSSMFTVGEVALARLALATVPGAGLDVVVGGLGLGFTAARVLEEPRVRSLIAVEALGEVIGWHERQLLPLSPGLISDRRCRLVHGDFFAMVAAGGLDPVAEGRRFDAICVDIDHSPRHVLHPPHAAFYRPEGLRRVADRLHPGGVFALWSNDPPDEEFAAALAEVFADSVSHDVEFDNPLQGRTAANTIYVATT